MEGERERERERERDRDRETERERERQRERERERAIQEEEKDRQIDTMTSITHWKKNRTIYRQTFLCSFSATFQIRSIRFFL